jgi:hypothetical protein
MSSIKRTRDEDKDDDTVSKMVIFINRYLNREKQSQNSSSHSSHSIHTKLPVSAGLAEDEYEEGKNFRRTSDNSQRIPRENEKKKRYIEAILNCLQILLQANEKHIIEHSFGDDTIGFYILDSTVTEEKLQKLLFNPDKNGETIGSIPKALISFGKITPGDKPGITKEHNKKIRECTKIIDLKRLHVGWVNGERGGPKLLGTIAMLYGILKLILDQNTMFGELDDDSDRSPYTIFGFKYVNQNSRLEASADFTNFEQMINEVTDRICNEYPELGECFEDAKKDFKETRGGKRTKKRKTKKRKTKRRKTKRRRKY